MLEKYLEKLSKVLDPQKAKESEELQRMSSRYEKVEKIPMMLGTFDDMSKERLPVFVDWPVYSYGEVFKYPEKMLLDELLPIYESAIIKDDRVNVIRANYGVGIIPSLFGLEVVQKGNELPWVKPLESIEEVKEIIKKGVPDFKKGLADRVNSTQDFYKNILNNYSNLKRSIHVGLLDNQGPFNLAGIMLGDNLYIYLYNNKDVIKELLQLLTEVYIEFSQVQKKLINEPFDTHYYFGCRLPSGVKISEDYGLAISPDMYKEFCIPYNEKVAEAFGGITLLICEDLEKKRLKEIIEMKGLKAIIYWSRNFNKLEEAYKIVKSMKVCIIWYGLIPDDKKSNFPTGLILKHQIKNLKEVKEILGGK